MIDLEKFAGKEVPETNMAIRAEAEAFYKIGMYAWEETENALVKDDDLVKKMYFVPAIVNLAFSCELFLKSTLSKPHGHVLKELFGQQCDVLKELIIAFMIDAGTVVSTEDEFYFNLDNISKAFVDWRYFYEKGGKAINIEFLKRFTLVLYSLKVAL